MLETPIRGKSPELKELTPEEPVEDMTIKPLDEMPELTIESPFDDVDVPDMSEPVPEMNRWLVKKKFIDRICVYIRRTGRGRYD